MKLGLSAKMRHDLYGRWGAKHYEKLKELGYDCVDLDLANTESTFYTDPAVLLEEKRLADAAGISFCQVHGPWRWPAKDFTKALTDIGYDGVLSLETLPSKDLPNEEYEQELKKLAELAKTLIP